MLLAVLEQAEDRPPKDGRVYLTQDLMRRFRRLFGKHSLPGDWCQPGPPFFHLRTACFWQLVPRLGREDHLRAMTTSGGGTRSIRENIECAQLSKEMQAALSDRAAREVLREAILRLLRDDGR